MLRAATWMGALSFGVLLVLTVTRYPWSAVLSIGPIIALQFGYIGAVEQRRERRRIEGLYRVASELRSAIDEQDILRRLAPAAQGLLDSQEARLTPEAPTTRPAVLRSWFEASITL